MVENSVPALRLRRPARSSREIAVQAPGTIALQRGAGLASVGRETGGRGSISLEEEREEVDITLGAVVLRTRWVDLHPEVRPALDGEQALG